MRWLYHLRPVGRSAKGRYTPDSLSTEGFVHASYRDDVLESARLHFPPGAPLEVLAIDPQRLGDVPVRVAATPRGDMPHIHGPLPDDAIVRVLPLASFEAERAAMPDEVGDVVASDGASRLGAAVGVDTRVRHARLALRGLVVSMGLVLLLAIPFGLSLSAYFFAGSLLAGLAGFFCFAWLNVVKLRGGPRLQATSIGLDPGSIRLEGPRGRTFPIADVAQGHREDPDLVRLEMKSGDVLVARAEREADADRLLRAAGVTAAERVLRAPLPSAASQVPFGPFLAAVAGTTCGAGLFVWLVALGAIAKGMFHDGGFANVAAFFVVGFVAAVFAAAAYTFAALVRRREVAVGTDGIAYKKAFGAEFIPYATLSSVVADTRGVRLVRKNGRDVLLLTRRALEPALPMAPPSSPPKTEAEAQRRVLLDRIGLALASHGESPLAKVGSRLQRNGRSAVEWRRELAQLLAVKGDYRNIEVSAEELGAVICDPVAPAEWRVAATVALAAEKGEEARARVRVAVQACADEDMQGALEAAAEGDIDEARLARAAAKQAGRG